MRNRQRYAALTAVLVLALSACGSQTQTGSVDAGGWIQSDSAGSATEEEDKGTAPEGDSGAEEMGESGGTECETETQESAPYPEIRSEEKIVRHGGVIQVGDAAYELYTYADSVADIYAGVVNHTAEELSGKARVYDLVVPLGIGIVFPDNLRDEIEFSDQRQAVSKIGEKMESGVVFVDFYNTLMQHRDEYLYFRTDHHWTALAAYYAYTEFCGAKGIEPEPLDGYETKVFDGFLGSFYFNDTGRDKRMKANPDVVTAYLPNKSAVCHVEDAKGVKYDCPVIYDETKAPAGVKYSAFIAGDNPYTEIVNEELADGSSCVVVKESYGNAFVPFLVDHYEKVYVIDYRYWTGSVCAFAGEKEVDDVIFINNLSMIGSNSLVGKLYRVR